MTTYLGMNGRTGRAMSDMAHIQQSVADIICTPIGSRLQRRTYGSLIFSLLDNPQNPATQLKVMSAIYSAVLTWEPRIALSSITLSDSDSRLTTRLVGRVSSNNQPFNLEIPLEAGQ
ncbi:baseplate assembly protein [Chania multitudinisentens RB-25]|uniref:Baseplate assembly protein n=1 Tax=Chania multitudinisentens RB-25 TaxID=1441930 RepID=W0L890_9GAMM|nr:GPW/gp25 family protein [Chania multitudinisentens]AHG18472.1 baseplate assembly protein [Chania multitudinisentens RB-25]